MSMMPWNASRGAMARIAPEWRGRLMADGGSSGVGRAALQLSGFGLALLALSIVWLGVTAVLGSVVLLMLKGAVLLASFIWVGVTTSRSDDRGRPRRASAGEVGYALACELARKPMLMMLVVLGLGLIRQA